MMMESVKLDRKLVLELLSLAGITALALALRWTASLQNGVKVFPDDDSYWHYHLEEQIVQFGHRLNPDPQAWLPLGRPETHPPLFHYAVAYAYLLLHYVGSAVSLFTVAYYSNLPAIILGVVSIYLLVRELYGRIPALSAAFLFATLPPSIGESLISVNKPAYATTWLCVLGFWLFVRAWRKEDKLSLVFPGILLGVASLAWEGTLYFFPPRPIRGVAPRGLEKEGEHEADRPDLGHARDIRGHRLTVVRVYLLDLRTLVALKHPRRHAR
jgi:asparagine N-glycosylation enzyme membrane subunit Stt3